VVTLAMKGIRFSYGPREVLRGVDLTVSPGTCVAVVGANGSGKSTLVRLALGREQPSDGQVLLDGRQVDDDEPWIRSCVAALNGPASHYHDLTVREHLELVALAHETSDAPVVIDETLSQTGLDGVQNVFPQHLSSGQAQALRVAALRVRPRQVVVLDEPEQHLDFRARSALAQWVVNECQAGVAVLLISHDPTVVRACADQVVVLAEGTIQTKIPMSRSAPAGDPADELGPRPTEEEMSVNSDLAWVRWVQ
jgi:ABC-2 type transport system ATP-binding protein